MIIFRKLYIIQHPAGSYFFINYQTHQLNLYKATKTLPGCYEVLLVVLHFYNLCSTWCYLPVQSIILFSFIVVYTAVFYSHEWHLASEFPNQKMCRCTMKEAAIYLFFSGHIHYLPTASTYQSSLLNTPVNSQLPTTTIEECHSSSFIVSEGRLYLCSLWCVVNTSIEISQSCYVCCMCKMCQMKVHWRKTAIKKVKKIP